jgi:hypothetical protein
MKDYFFTGDEQQKIRTTHSIFNTEEQRLIEDANWHAYRMGL